VKALLRDIGSRLGYLGEKINGIQHIWGKKLTEYELFASDKKGY